MARTVAEKSDIIPKLAECFRQNGYEGSSISVISHHTGLGKGSLYHFFPGGKEMMVDEVLSDIHEWFEQAIYRPLEAGNSEKAITQMFDNTIAYFDSGRRVCLLGAFALDRTRDSFAQKISFYFERWIDVLGRVLVQLGHTADDARALAIEVVGGIQGAIVLSRSLDDPGIFLTTISTLRSRVAGV